MKRYVQRIETSSGDHDLSAIVAESLYFVRLRAADRGVRVEVESSAEPLLIQGEQILIGQVVINLCMNAIDEAGGQPDCPEKRIVVRTFAADGQACCSVTDWGGGGDGPADPGTSGRAAGAGPAGGGVGQCGGEGVLPQAGWLGHRAGPVAADPGAPSRHPRVENNHPPGGTVFTLRLPLHELRQDSELLVRATTG